MSVSFREELPGKGASATVAATSAGTVGGAPDGGGRLLARLTVLPALLTVTFLLGAFPLLVLGWFKPLPVLLLWGVLAAAIVPAAWRRIPPVTGVGGPRTPWWTVVAVVAVALAFGVDQAIYHSQAIIAWRDPGAYMEFASWVSKHGSLPIPQHAAAFGGAPGIAFGSAAFYQVGGSIVPQFMAGLPMVLSTGFWAGGARLAVLLPPLLGAAAVFTFGGLTARLVGPRWAPLASLVLAVSLPQQYTSRASFSEPLAQIVFLAGLALVVDAQRVDNGTDGVKRGRAWWRNDTRVLAGLAGLGLGITLLVRLDGPSDILPLIPFCGLLLLLRRPRQVVPLFGGLVVGLAYGAFDGWMLARPYVYTNISSVKPMIFVFGVAVALTGVVVMVLWERGLPRVPSRLADLAALLPFVIIAGFAIRPYVQKDWEKLQYAPISLHWVYWYIGGPAILLATVAAALLTRRCLRGEAAIWVLPLMVFAWTIVEGLYRPAITPDQPWASRRFVPAILPGFILLATWFAAWLTRTTRGLRFEGAVGRLPQLAVAGCCAVALLVPTVMTTFGLGVTSSGSGGLRPTIKGTAFERTYVGEIAAVEALCKALPPNASVLIVDHWLIGQVSEDIRGICGIPVAYPIKAYNWAVVPTSLAAAEVGAIERTGRRPVVLGSNTSQLAPFTVGTVRRVMTLNTQQDERIFLGKPQHTMPFVIRIYMWERNQ